jgi:hypothetical protein
MPAPLARLLLIACALLPAGCGAETYEWSGALLGANAAAIPVFHRDVFDLVYSGVTGRDCSVVRLDADKSYCRPVEPPPAPPPYCTRSIGAVDCWPILAADGPSPSGWMPPMLTPRGFEPQIASGPYTLSPAQEADRVRRWPPL